MSCVQCSSIFPARTINSVLSVACQSLIKSLILICATTVNLMLDLPRLSSSPVTQLPTLLIFGILSHIIPTSFYVSVYEFYLAISKTVSMQCISRRWLTSCLISCNSSPLLVFVISPLGKTFQNKNLQNMIS